MRKKQEPKKNKKKNKKKKKKKKKKKRERLYLSERIRKRVVENTVRIVYFALSYTTPAFLKRKQVWQR